MTSSLCRYLLKYVYAATLTIDRTGLLTGIQAAAPGPSDENKVMDMSKLNEGITNLMKIFAPQMQVELPPVRALWPLSGGPLGDCAKLKLPVGGLGTLSWGTTTLCMQIRTTLECGTHELNRL